MGKKTRLQEQEWVLTYDDLIIMDDNEIYKHLMEIGILQDREGQTCPVCKKAELGKLLHPEFKCSPCNRCSGKGCQRYIGVAYDHALIMNNTNGKAPTIQKQAGIIFLLNAGCSHQSIKLITGCGYKSIQEMSRRLDDVRRT